MTTTPPSTPTPTFDRFFDTLRRSPVKRSQDRVIAGVAAGVADRLGMSPGVIRVGMVAVALLGAGVPLYLLAWLLIPDYQGRIRLESAVREGQASSIVLLVVTVLSVVTSLFGPVSAAGYGAGLWLLLVFAALAIFGVGGRFGGGREGHRHDQPESRDHAPASVGPTGPNGPQDAPNR